MANSYSGMVWRLTNTGVVTTDSIKIKAIRWEGAKVVNDTVVLLDNKATPGYIWESTCDVAKTPDESHDLDIRSLTGLQVNTISNGVVYVYLA